MNRLREKFQRFMIGRYGMDQLGQFMVWAVLVLIVINLFVRASLPSTILDTLELVGLITMYFRMFSKNVGKRYQENQVFLRMRFYVTEYWRKVKFKGANTGFLSAQTAVRRSAFPEGMGKSASTAPNVRRILLKRREPALQYHGFSDSSCMDVAYSDGVMVVSFLNCLEK